MAMGIGSIVVAAMATGLGIFYALLGLAALKYLPNAGEIDKAAGWTLWWCLDAGRYTEEGQKLCKKGQLVALATIALWIATYIIKW